MPRTIPFFICDSFTDTPFQGNPAGVFFDDNAALTEDEMRQLCAEISLESAFVLPSPDEEQADRRLRYFTGVTEVPLCGHATIAAATVLSQEGRLQPGQTLRAATQVGTLPISLDGSGKSVTLYQTTPRFDFGAPEMGSGIDSAAVAAALGIAPEHLSPSLSPRRVSTGTPWLFVPVTTRDIVDTASADFTRIDAISRQYHVYGMYVFAWKPGAPVWGRCYAPTSGLNEDPVTGSASGALGGYLAECGALDVPPGGSATFTTQQGFAGGRGGTVQVTVAREQDGSFKRVAVTGRALVLARGAFTLP